MTPKIECLQVYGRRAEPISRFKWFAIGALSVSLVWAALGLCFALAQGLLH